MELIQAVELLIDEGRIPEIVPDAGKYVFEVDSSSLVELVDKGDRVVVQCGIANLSQIQADLAFVLDRWLGLSLAEMTTSDSVLSYDEGTKLISLYRLLDLKSAKEAGLLAAIEALVGDAEGYRETLK